MAPHPLRQDFYGSGGRVGCKEYVIPELRALLKLQLWYYVRGCTTIP